MEPQMTNLVIFPLSRWREADPDRIIDLACAANMSIDATYELIHKIAARLDGRMRRMGFSAAQRRAALGDWETELRGLLIWLVVREPRDRAPGKSAQHDHGADQPPERAAR